MNVVSELPEKAIANKTYASAESPKMSSPHELKGANHVSKIEKLLAASPPTRVATKATRRFRIWTHAPQPQPPLHNTPLESECIFVVIMVLPCAGESANELCFAVFRTLRPEPILLNEEIVNSDIQWIQRQRPREAVLRNPTLRSASVREQPTWKSGSFRTEDPDLARIGKQSRREAHLQMSPPIAARPQAVT